MTSSPISRVFPTFDGIAALPSSTDALAVGVGPTGSTAAVHATRAGFSVTVVDSQRLPCDKTCGDGLTPRAIAELRRLGLDGELLCRNRNRGFKLHGFGGFITTSWPDDVSGTFPAAGSATSRVELDAFLLDAAADAGAQVLDRVTAWKAVLRALSSGDTRGHGAHEVELSDREGKPHTIPAYWLFVADGIRSIVDKQLGRVWHHDSIFGMAARPYVSFDSVDVANDWIHSHLELRDSEGQTHPGYGWIFPLGAGQTNVGCGALMTSARPAHTNVKKLLREYHEQMRKQWQVGEPEHATSALLPMGGAASSVAGPDWALLGDAACLADPLNGEGTDYGMESAWLTAELTSSTGAGHDGLTRSWPALFHEHYGIGFLLARKLALTLMYPSFLPTVGPLTIGASWGSQLMGAAARLMGNLIAEHGRDVMVRLWRAPGQTALTPDKWFRCQSWW